MSQDPRIEAAARQVAVEHGYPASYFPDGMAEVHAKSYRQQAARILAAADKAATIATVEGLDALPVGSVIIIAQGGVWEKYKTERWGWRETGITPSGEASDITLPARVIHWGTE